MPSPGKFGKVVEHVNLGMPKGFKEAVESYRRKLASTTGEMLTQPQAVLTLMAEALAVHGILIDGASEPEESPPRRHATVTGGLVKARR